MWRCWCLVEIFCWCLVEILKMKCDQDLCLNFWYDFKKLLCQDELNPRGRCAFGNVFLYFSFFNQVTSIFHLRGGKIKKSFFWAYLINTHYLSGLLIQSFRFPRKDNRRVFCFIPRWLHKSTRFFSAFMFQILNLFAL